MKKDILSNDEAIRRAFEAHRPSVKPMPDALKSKIMAEVMRQSCENMPAAMPVAKKSRIVTLRRWVAVACVAVCVVLTVAIAFMSNGNSTSEESLADKCGHETVRKENVSLQTVPVAEVTQLATAGQTIVKEKTKPQRAHRHRAKAKIVDTDTIKTVAEDALLTAQEAENESTPGNDPLLEFARMMSDENALSSRSQRMEREILGYNP